MKIVVYTDTGTSVGEAVLGPGDDLVEICRGHTEGGNVVIVCEDNVQVVSIALEIAEEPCPTE